MYIEWFEEYAINRSKNQLSLRYDDDTFIIWQHGLDALGKCLQHLNNLMPSIQFTNEGEKNGSIPFLDIQEKKNS